MKWVGFKFPTINWAESLWIPFELGGWTCCISVVVFFPLPQPMRHPSRCPQATGNARFATYSGHHVWPARGPQSEVACSWLKEPKWCLVNLINCNGTLRKTNNWNTKNEACLFDYGDLFVACILSFLRWRVGKSLVISRYCISKLTGQRRYDIVNWSWELHS